ncbi:MAG: 1-acyl-sn-glycerol-3-phosphate acyltransferase [Myxococcota bacterium]
MTRPSPKHRGVVFEGLRRRLGLTQGEDPGAWDPRAIDRLDSTVGRLFGRGCYFDTSVEGFERVPAPPALLVSNHSGGTLIPDVWGLGLMWYRHFGRERPLYILGHELLFATPWSGRFFERCGVLRAAPGRAHRVLTEFRRDLLVLPGGDVDTWRPWTERYTVNFAGRTGYAQLAIRAGVPIVPVAHAGAHETLMVLRSGKRIARWFGLHQLARAEVWPLHLSLPWGLALGPVPHWPLPARFEYLLGQPISPPRVESPETIRDLDARVRSVIQVQLNELAARRRR